MGELLVRVALSFFSISSIVAKFLWMTSSYRLSMRSLPERLWFFLTRCVMMKFWLLFYSAFMEFINWNKKVWKNKPSANGKL